MLVRLKSVSALVELKSGNTRIMHRVRENHTWLRVTSLLQSTLDRHHSSWSVFGSSGCCLVVFGITWNMMGLKPD